MIYLVSDRIKADGLENVKVISVQESLGMIQSWPVVQFDTETTGLDARVNKLVSMQFGYKDFKTGETTRIVVDCLSVNPALYKETIEGSYLIGHNLKFDLKFLYNHSIVPLVVYDTMVIEQLLYLGYSPKQVTFNLHDVLLRHTGIELDKSYQKQIAEKGLTPEGVLYAADDVLYLQDIRRSQITTGQSRDCLRAFVVENRFVPAIAYLEWCGIHLDEEKWRRKMLDDTAKLTMTRTSLDNFVRDNTELSKRFMSTFSQPSIFDPNPTFNPTCTVDWNSPAQVIPVAQALGFDTRTGDKNTGKEKDSVEEDVLSVQKGVNDEFLSLYFGFKGASKTVSSYGQGHINLINPNTGRLHTEFKQFGTVTGRMSSGGSGKEGKQNKDLAKLKGLKGDDVRFVNLQNLPARGDEGVRTRACFTSEPGNVFVSCDYSAEESRVSANVWNEKALKDAFDNGIDTHNLYAKMCFPDELKDIDVKDVKKYRPDLRQAAKSAEFAVSYGSDGTSIAASIGMPVEKAKEMVQGILKGMPGMMAYKKKTVKFLKEHGYIVINRKTGHRIYWPEWSEWKAEEDSFDRRFWIDYNIYHRGTGDDIDRKVKKHRNKSHDWFEKNVLNYPIQGGSAVVLKQAAADLFDWVVNNGYFGVVLFCVFVHDEIDCECPKDIGDMFSKVLKSTMERAADMFYSKVKVPAEVQMSNHWVH